MIASLKCQYAELLSDIGFIKADLTTRQIGRLAPRTGDGVLAATGDEVCHWSGLVVLKLVLARDRVGILVPMVFGTVFFGSVSPYLGLSVSSGCRAGLMLRVLKQKRICYLRYDICKWSPSLASSP